VYIDSFDSGMPEQRINFQTKLRIIISGNGLDENGPVCFNLMHALLNGDAPLRLFDERANELTANKDGYTENKTDDIICPHSVTEHVFPYQVLQSQKCHMAEIFTQGPSINFALAGINLTTILSNSQPPFGEN
jgi:hypothetical protein